MTYDEFLLKAKHFHDRCIEKVQAKLGDKSESCFLWEVPDVALVYARYAALISFITNRLYKKYLETNNLQVGQIT